MAIFGQNPADITGAIFKSKNFSDVPDKAAARNNLDVPSKAEVLYNSVPIGMILPYWGNVAPAGYLPCSGQTVTSGTFPELVTFLGGGASQVVPDLRGEFLRGWDNGRGVDTGRTLGSYQTVGGLVMGIEGRASVAAGVVPPYTTTVPSDGTFTSWLNTGDANSSSDVDTRFSLNQSLLRPRNAAVLYCIKAYSSVQNYTSSINIAGLVSDYSTLSAAAAKYADFQGTNQGLTANGWQKLPGGLIVQWGVTGSISGNTAATTTLPIAFPSSCTLVTSIGNASGTAQAANYITSKSTTSFSQYNAGSVASVFNWIALGY